MNILVRAPNWIGDQILAFPFFHFLRERFPGAWIASACADWVADCQYLDLVNETVVIPRPRPRPRPRPSEPGLLARTLALDRAARTAARSRSWDLGISLPNSFSAAWFLWRAGARIRRGYVADGRGLLLNDRLDWDPNPEIHRGQAYLDLLPFPVPRPARVFWGASPENTRGHSPEGEPERGEDPPLLGVLERFDPGKSWPSSTAIEPPAGQYWILAPGATAESRRWPAASFVTLARRIRDETGWKGLIVGGQAEKESAAQLAQDSELGLEDWCARGAITAYARVFARSRVTVCNESGLAHVASLCGSPTQIICGAANPVRTRPLGPGPTQVTINAIECWPCERNICLNESDLRNACLRGISPDEVWEEIEKLVGKTG